LRLCEKKRIRRAQGEKKEKKGAQSRQAAKSAAAESNTERTTVSLRLCAFARLKNKKNPPLNVEFYIQKVIPTQEMEHRLKVGIDPKKRVNGKKHPSNPANILQILQNQGGPRADLTHPTLNFPYFRGYLPNEIA
jgi:hypothetical protein